MFASDSQTMSEVSPSTSYLQDSVFLEKIRCMDTLCKEETLIKAVNDGNEELVQILIDLDVSVHASEYIRFHRFRMTMTPLMIAAYNNFLPCLQILINNGANVNSTDQYDVTALHLAAEMGHLDCLKALLEAGANGNASTKKTLQRAPHCKGTTPLHLATSNKHIECMKELMAYSVDYNAIDEDGASPLYIAAHLGYDECVQVLLNNAVGHDILSLPGFVTGDTPLHLAVKHFMIGSVRELLRFGSDVNHQNHIGDTPLHICVKEAKHRDPEVSLQMLKLLVLCGNSDVNIRNFNDFTPLHYATYKRFCRRPDLANFLIAYGADIFISYERSSNLLSFEYNSKDSETSILETCVQSILTPPCPKDLKNNPDQVPNYNQMAMIAFQNLLLGQEDAFHDIHRNGLPVGKRTVKKQRWYEKNIYVPIPSLKHHCRYAIRSYMGYKKFKYIKCLNIPPSLKSYILLGADVIC